MCPIPEGDDYVTAAEVERKQQRQCAKDADGELCAYWTKLQSFLDDQPDGITEDEAYDEQSRRSARIFRRVYNTVEHMTRCREGTDQGSATVVGADDSGTRPAVEVPGDWSLRPRGINRGGRFRLLFITDDWIRPNCPLCKTKIPYVGHIRAAIAKGHADLRSHAVRFRPVVCTAQGDYEIGTAGSNYDINRAYTGASVHWIGGLKVADNYADFIDGDWTNYAGTDRRNHLGQPSNRGTQGDWPLTGCGAGGTAKTGHGLGSDMPWSGRLPPNHPIDGGTNQAKDHQHSIYGISPEFLVTSDPEPEPYPLGTEGDYFDDGIKFEATWNYEGTIPVRAPDLFGPAWRSPHTGTRNTTERQAGPVVWETGIAYSTWDDDIVRGDRSPIVFIRDPGTGHQCHPDIEGDASVDCANALSLRWFDEDNVLRAPTLREDDIAFIEVKKYEGKWIYEFSRKIQFPVDVASGKINATHGAINMQVWAQASDNSAWRLPDATDSPSPVRLRSFGDFGAGHRAVFRWESRTYLDVPNDVFSCADDREGKIKLGLADLDPDDCAAEIEAKRQRCIDGPRTEQDCNPKAKEDLRICITDRREWLAVRPYVRFYSGGREWQDVADSPTIDLCQ